MIVSTHIRHIVRMAPDERFRLTLPTGEAEIEQITAERWDREVWHVRVSGWVIKKDGMVGNARRQHEVPVTQLPQAVQGVLLPLVG